MLFRSPLESDQDLMGGKKLGYKLESQVLWARYGGAPGKTPARAFCRWDAGAIVDSGGSCEKIAHRNSYEETPESGPYIPCFSHAKGCRIKRCASVSAIENRVDVMETWLSMILDREFLSCRDASLETPNRLCTIIVTSFQGSPAPEGIT